MRWITTIALVFVASQAWAGDALWQKAVDLAEQNANWVPGTMVMEGKQTTPKGKVKETFETVLRLYLDEEGEVTSELVKVLENGEDITEKARKEQEEAERKGEEAGSDDEEGTSVSISLSEDNIFLPKNQEKVTVTPTAQRATINNHRCIGFDFIHSMQADTVKKGRAWLDEESGVPVRITHAPDPLPKHVTAMDTTVDYHYGPEGEWYPSSMTMTGAGGMLFIKRNFEMATTFKDYWIYEEPSPEESETAR